MAVRPVDLQDSSKSATVVRSDSAVMDVLGLDRFGDVTIH